jgi:antitoxin MazE
MGKMVKDTVLRPFGNSTGVTIPKAMLDRMHVGSGDRLHLVETEKGILLTPYDPRFEAVMAAYAEGAALFRNAMRELAK